MKSVTIIGGGVGGLFTGAILAKEGWQVTILEKNATVGGGLQSFRRFSEVFDTGMHVVGGMNPGGNIYRLCQYLGIDSKINIHQVDSACMDRIWFDEDGACYEIASGREGFVSSLASYFPSQKEALVRYVQALERLSGEVDLFNLRPSNTLFPKHSDEFFMPASAFIAKYISDRRLRAVVAYLNPFYGGRPDYTPAYVHVIISWLYIMGSSRFAGGSGSFAELLAGVVTSRGGVVSKGDAVSQIIMDGKEITGVVTASGRRYKSDYYISAIHPCTLLGLLPPTAFTKAYRDRLNGLPNTYSAFLLFLKIKEDTFPYINTSEYFMTRYDDVWNFSREDKPWPLGFLFMTPPEVNQGSYSTKVLVTAPMLYSAVSRWENTTTGRRGPQYESFKQECASSLLAMIEKIHPGFRDVVDGMNTSSPLTIRDYYGVKEGSICGFSKDCNNILESQLPVVTKIPNLLLTGQNNNLHGFCGTALTAISTAEVLTGRNSIVTQL